MGKETKISTVGMNCPKPLIETRKALRKLSKGDVLVVEGDHNLSKDEIPQAMKDTGEEVISVDVKGSNWVITIKKGS